MDKKKTYIAPNLIIVKAETQDMIATSGESKLITDKTFDLANKWNEKGQVEENAELPISAKHYNAWDAWDE